MEDVDPEVAMDQSLELVPLVALVQRRSPQLVEDFVDRCGYPASCLSTTVGTFKPAR
jgi:hypothetical protein